MKRLSRLSILFLLVSALVLPAGAAQAAQGKGDGGPLCRLLAWGCEHDDEDEGEDEGDVVVRPTPAGLIQGVAVDARGSGLDGAAVQALDASTGVPVASALTYASARASGPQHGYFYLHVKPGVYDVVLVKRGYDAAFVQDVTVTRRQPLSLGQLELEPRAWPTRTVAGALDAVVTPRQSVVVSAVVASRKAEITGGRIVVSEGRTVLAVKKLTKRHQGSVTVDVGRLARGTHKLAVEFKGTEGLEGSSAKTVRVTVATNAARASTRPLRP